MDSIDKLLAEIKTEYTEEKKPAAANNLTPVNLDLPITKADVLMDNLLSEVQAEVAENKIPDIQYQPTSYYHLPPIQLIHSSDNKSDVFMDNLLADVKADIAEQEAVEQRLKQEELAQEKIRQEKIKVEQRKALEKPAKKWLAKLDPLSSEGLWFERFAEGYPDKLAAAIDYLESNG
ncbi:MAG: salt stress protein, Slr1339 family [Cuspidothrix sp.]